MRYVRAALICLVCSLAMAFPVRAEGGKTSFFDSINAVLSGFDIGIGGTLLATGCVLLIRTDMAREKTRLEARAAC